MTQYEEWPEAAARAEAAAALREDLVDQIEELGRIAAALPEISQDYQVAIEDAASLVRAYRA